MTSRLLSEADARAYCGGVNPHKVCAPRRFGRAIRWDRCEIDAALDAPWKREKPSESEEANDGFDVLERLNSVA